MALLSLLGLHAVGSEKTYYLIGTEQGLSGQHVLQMMQLADGRMVVDTENSVCLWDGVGFCTVQRDNADYSLLPGYKEFTRLFVDKDHRLWIKDMGKVACLDLRTLQFLPQCTKLIDLPEDFYIDGQGEIWTVKRQQIRRQSDGLTLYIPSGCERVQDVLSDSAKVYVFTSDGALSQFDVSDGRLLASSTPFTEGESHWYDKYSQVVRSADGRFYQIRTGWEYGVFLSFDPSTSQWKRYLEDFPLHTLIVTPEQKAYISCGQGYWEYDIKMGRQRRLEQLRLPDGTMLQTGFNTICQDREGGIWLGSYDLGIFYCSPLNGIFDMREQIVPLTPVLTAVFLHGKRLRLEEDVSYIRQLNMQHDQNALSFQFSAMKFVRPRHVFYRYRLNGGEWESGDNMIDEHGRLYLSLVGLSSGKYTLDVMATADTLHWNGGVYSLSVVISPAWWQTWWACIMYIFMVLIILSAIVCLYVRSMKRKAEQRRREEVLLTQIQNLVEKCNQLESGVSVILRDTDDVDNIPQMSRQEIEFLNRATRLVEQNLANTDYSVELLASDLCMERTGLYKRLTALMQKSPKAFIRTIRLERAALLLKEGGHTVTEVSEMTGFSSPQYFNKCFQQQYGCRPSEYVKM